VASRQVNYGSRYYSRNVARPCNVLVLYLERPPDNSAQLHTRRAGRFGYSDLKEAAPIEGYVL
jgi:hypothetical protein